MPTVPTVTLGALPGGAAAPRRSRADDVYEQLKLDVARFNLVPGDRFTENEISGRLGVSRTWIQEFEAARGGASIDTVLRALGELGISLSIEIPGGARPTPEAQPDLDLDALIDSHRDDR